MFSPKALGDGGEESAMSGDKTVGAFGTSSEHLGMNVPVEEPLFARIVGERAESGLSAGVNRAVRLNEMDGCFKLLARNFGKSLGDGGILIRQVIQLFAGDMTPAPNPDAAKSTVAIKHHERLWWRGGDGMGRFHAGSNSGRNQKLQVFGGCTPG